MRISDWSSDVCSSDLPGRQHGVGDIAAARCPCIMAAAPAPLCHFVAVHAHAIEEEFQRELGMCLNGAPARTTDGIGIKRNDAVPFFGVPIEIEVGQIGSE